MWRRHDGVGVLSETDGLACLLAEKYGGRRGSKEVTTRVHGLKAFKVFRLATFITHIGR